MRFASSSAVFLAASLLAGAPVLTLAHHSTAEFDYSKNLTLTGTVKEVQWMNPHSYVEILVPGDDGQLTQWAIEIGAPLFNTRMGWKRDSLCTGDRVTVNIAPARNGKPHGTLRTVTLPDGKQLRGAASIVGSDKNGFPVFPVQSAEPATPPSSTVPSAPPAPAEK
jgi:hypothetical protein